MVECTCLENRSLGNWTVSSNLTASARRKNVEQLLGVFCSLREREIRSRPERHWSERGRRIPEEKTCVQVFGGGRISHASAPSRGRISVLLLIFIVRMRNPLRLYVRRWYYPLTHEGTSHHRHHSPLRLRTYRCHLYCSPHRNAVWMV